MSRVQIPQGPRPYRPWAVAELIQYWLYGIHTSHSGIRMLLTRKCRVRDDRVEALLTEFGDMNVSYLTGTPEVTGLR